MARAARLGARGGTRMRILVGRGGASRPWGTRPRIFSINPNAGPPAGGTIVTINGINFADATAVNFGASPVAFTVVNDNRITATAPPGSGVVSITVETPEGTSGSANFRYVSLVPTITNLNPNAGSNAGGTSVTIFGTNFTGVTSINFGGVVLSPIAAPAAPTVGSINPTSGAPGTPVTITGTGFLPVAGFTVVSATQINVITPAGSGAANVTVTTPNGTSAPGTFTYAAAPTVASINPTSGPAGTTVTITGTNFQ